jgi:hypothetical protein
MLPSAHYFSGVTIFALLSIFGIIPMNFLYLNLIIILSIIPDVDLIITSSHREVFTHSPIFWMVIIAAAILFKPGNWIIVIPLSTHLLLDTVDWGLMIFYPFSSKKYGFKLLEKQAMTESKRFTSYLREYVSHPKLLYVEFAIMILSLLLLLAVSICI